MAGKRRKIRIDGPSGPSSEYILLSSQLVTVISESDAQLDLLKSSQALQNASINSSSNVSWLIVLLEGIVCYTAGI